MHEKLKAFLTSDTLFMGTLLILVAIVAFLLGRYSVTEIVSSRQPATVQAGISAEFVPKNASLEPYNGEVVASRSGSKYHALTCPGASQIKESNKIVFAHAAAAVAAGYEPAANCPVLAP